MSRRLAVPVALHGLAFLLMARGVDPVPTFFYPLAWWTYIWAISAVNSRLGANSLLFERRAELWRMALLSIPLWLFFEAFNFRLQNWSYIGVPAEAWLRLPGYPIAFATVLPGIFETRTLLANLNFPRDGSGRLLRTSSGLLVRSVVLGTLMMAGPLLWPHLYFPLVWVGFILMLDPLLYRWKDEGSVLAAAEKGDYRETIRMLAAGLACGVLWEFWNYWAGAKWIYTIPYLGFLKIFEMPLLGYFGFPLFALECWLIWRVFERLRRSWSPARKALVVAMAVAFSVAIIYGIEERTILSYRAVW